jgi:hypothetical protein
VAQRSLIGIMHVSRGRLGHHASPSVRSVRSRLKGWLRGVGPWLRHRRVGLAGGVGTRCWSEGGAGLADRLEGAVELGGSGAVAVAEEPVVLAAERGPSWAESPTTASSSPFPRPIASSVARGPQAITTLRTKTTTFRAGWTSTADERAPPGGADLAARRSSWSLWARWRGYAMTRSREPLTSGAMLRDTLVSNPGRLA